MTELIRSLLGAKSVPSELNISAVIYGQTEPEGLRALSEKLRTVGTRLQLEILHHTGEDVRAALLAAQHELVICAEPSAWLDFAERALRLLTSTEVDLVVSSKLLPGASAHLPFFPREARRFYHYVLRRAVGLRGTDTLGAKAFRRSRLLPILEQCRTSGAAFSSELVIRAQRAGLDVREVAEQCPAACAPAAPTSWRAPALFGAAVQLTRTLGRKD